MAKHDAEDIVAALIDVFETGSISEGSILDDVRRSPTFEQAGLLTSDSGIVLRMTDGSEYQITVVQSRRIP